MRWRWGWRDMVKWQRWAWSPRKGSPQGSLTTFRGAGPTGSVVTAQPWAFGGRRQASGREGGVRRHSRCLTRSQCLSAEDLSLERLLWWTPLSARFDPALRWARNAFRSSEGLSCRSASGPMFAAGTEGPMVGWGGASPTNCSQLDFISRMKSSFQVLIMYGEEPCEGFTASGCVTVGATEARPRADGGTGFPVGWTKGGVAPKKTSAKARGWGGGWCRRVHFRVWKSRNSRWYRCKASWERSWEASCRSWKSCLGSRRRSRLEHSDNWSGYGGTPSGPHPGWRRSRVEGRWQWHHDPGGLNLVLKRPRGVLICGERCRETIASCRRSHRRTGTGRSGRLRGWSRRVRQVTPYMGQEVLVGLRRGRRRKEVILVAWRRGHTFLWTRQRGPRLGRDQRNRPWRYRHDGGRRARHNSSLSPERRSGARRGGRQLLRGWAQAGRGRGVILAVAP